jgi:hypothetical protein
MKKMCASHNEESEGVTPLPNEERGGVTLSHKEERERVLSHNE